jgi:serine/threonine protein kinase
MERSHLDLSSSGPSDDPQENPFPILTIPETELNHLQYQLDHFNESFMWGPQLGKGSYGEIYQLISKKTQQEYAIKIFAQENITDKLRNMIECEAEIIRGFEIPHVITYYAKGPVNFMDKPYIGILMEYIPGQTLEQVRVNCKLGDPFSEYELLQLMKQTLIGIGSLHSIGVAHRDIKPENIIYYEHDVTIIDLGLSCCSPCPKNGPFSCRERKGTPLFMPIELFNLKQNQLNDIPIEFLKAGDIWAFGVTFFFMVYGVYPYDADDLKLFVKKLRKREMTPVPDKPEMSLVIDVIENAMLPLNQRPTALELLELVEDYLDDLDEEGIDQEERETINQHHDGLERQEDGLPAEEPEEEQLDDLGEEEQDDETIEQD